MLLVTIGKRHLVYKVTKLPAKLSVVSVDEMLKAATGAAAALKAAPFESDSEHCGFNTANGLPMFQFYAKNPAHAKRFASAMAGATSVDRQISELRDSYDWNALKGTVVDVGGGSGHVSVSLAQVSQPLSI